jgi:hypothetical protein
MIFRFKDPRTPLDFGPTPRRVRPGLTRVKTSIPQSTARRDFDRINRINRINRKTTGLLESRFAVVRLFIGFFVLITLFIVYLSTIIEYDGRRLYRKISR